MSSTGQRLWRTCSLRTAGKTPRYCGRSLAVPQESPATIQVGASHFPCPPSIPPCSILGCMGWDGQPVGYSDPVIPTRPVCLGWALPCLSPSPSLLPQPPHGEPPRRLTCMTSEGDPGKQVDKSWAGHPFSSPPLLPAPLPPNIQASKQGAASSIQFSFHTSLPLENGSHHPGRPPSCLCSPPLPSPHCHPPPNTPTPSGLRDQPSGGVPMDEYGLCRVGQPLPCLFQP